MPSYQVNDGNDNYGRNGSYNNYGYRQESSGGVAMTREKDRDRPPAYNGNHFKSSYGMFLKNRSVVEIFSKDLFHLE